MTQQPFYALQRRNQKRDCDSFERVLRVTLVTIYLDCSHVNHSLQNQIFDYHKSDFMQDAGMVVNPQPIQIRGRVLPTPQILYGQGQMVNICPV